MGVFVFVFVFWVFYPVSLIYMSGFVPVPYCFDYCSFVVLSGKVILPILLFLKIVLVIWDLLVSIQILK